MSILQAMKERVLYFDGGYGSLMQSKGLKPGALGEMWNLEKPDVITGIHADYLRAGCDILKSNTFNTNVLKFPDDGPYSVETVIQAAFDNARAALAAVPSDRERYIALDMGPTGKLLEPLGDLSFDDCYDMYARNVRAGVKAGADLILIETMSDTYEIKAAVLAAKENSDLPIFVTVTFDANGQLLTGCDIPGVVALLEGLRVDAIGMNCGLGPIQMRPLLDILLNTTSLPVIMNPNAGLPRTENGATVYDIDDDTFSDVMADMVQAGIRVAGGCCGTTPAFIGKVTAKTAGFISNPPQEKNITLISSYAKSVEIGPDPIIIGERINPTGKKKLKAALQAEDMNYILKEAVAQQQAGAHVLDINVGLPGLDEPYMLTKVMREVQSVTDLPLQLDSSDFQAMESAMRYYNGKPLINSVSGKEETMEAIFPLVAKYGGVVVGLCLDHDGIPETAEGRIRIAKKIYATAASYGIAPKDIIIDGLTMTVSTNGQAALTTLETIRRVRDELHGHTILGVSNVSFGLPVRENLNSEFFTLAMHNGLSAAIVNPCSEAMMRAWYTYRALSGIDVSALDYIGKYNDTGKTAPSKLKVVSEMSLTDAIVGGLKDAASTATKKALELREPLIIINEELIPALNIVGDGFEKKKVFLPQLLMSADAAKSAFDVIKEYVQSHGEAQESKGTIVIATVKDDIHDIGKNIVKTLLENYGYTVIDLGRDVPPETVVSAVLDNHASLCGLSALMTTTVPNMAETIRQLHAQAPFCKIMVGGAVLTQDYADEIGADFYGKDAMASVRYAEEVFG